MATNDFYYGNRPPSANPSQQQQTQYYSGGRSAYEPSIASTPAPPYSPAPAGDAPGHRQPPRANTVSPFDTVFDDPNPTDSTQDGFRHNNMAYNNQYGNNYNNAYGAMPNQNPYGTQDTAYYGGGVQGTSPVTGRPAQAYFGDEMSPQNPAQSSTQALNEQPNKDIEMSDHVYDGRGQGASATRSKKSKKVGLGQLGMLGADKKRIPWVCYIFTVAQIGTFIGLIVKNGRFSPVATHSRV